MPRYRRNMVSGGSFFFTVTLADRQSRALTEHIDVFRAAYRTVHSRSPFETVAICVLPDHFHEHAWVNRVSDWPYSSFHRYVRLGLRPIEWAGSMAVAEGFGE